MEHEVFVPVPVPVLRRTLGDPARVARCVPGLQQDADASAGPLAGRLKVRVGGHTITYRGALRLTPLTDGPAGDSAYGLVVAGEGVEARGTGSVKLALTVRLAERDGGTAITFDGTAGGDGRLLELDAAVTLAAAHRLLGRFAQQLVTEALAAHDSAHDSAYGGARDAAGGSGDSEDSRDSGDDSVDGGADVPVAGSEERSVGDAVERAIEEAAEAADESDAEETPPTHDAAADEEPAGEQSPDKDSVFDAPVPPPSLDPVAGIEFAVPDGPPAEAAHARRTMIGRSAEEVDHAPPRGRYAPVPSPDSTGAGATLRWVAPAAALAIASAVVVGRALRRRR
ncbi:carbon monoxide dehydrogenase subunit G [Streptomyces brevispora]|uniref:Carbon monoxide dehydrogenase subunit G n=1 Tax=Streptomyces brevispora TaxID=887462 RepID=A0A561UXN1_9ACTN|nr:SRPBCC domain-containing protein [Streptomyces brevispora]TWG04122.1 carbon monoxide dehydrogenase subunit G [Streptomyces brevispora]